MKSPIRDAFLLAAAISLLVGCSTGGGSMSGSTGTGVNLDHRNYRMIKAGARGEDHGFWFLFFPIAFPSYADAKQQLYASVGESLDGRAAALANQTEDKSVMTLIVFTITKLTLTADVIEFIDTDGAQAEGTPR